MGYVFDRKIKEEERHILKNVYKDFFKDNPISIKVRLEGQSLDKNNNYQIGLRAGPSIEISNLFHEMGHLAEREPNKLVKKTPFWMGIYLRNNSVYFGAFNYRSHNRSSCSS